MWVKSELREKIVIGHHKFDSNTGEAHDSRYRNVFNGKYDGVHFYGPNGRKDFTKSIMNILTFAFPTEFLLQPQELASVNWPELGGSYSRLQYQPESNRTAIQTSNRFGVLNPDMGNF